MGTLLFQITNDNYLAHFLLILCLVLPVLSLALSLPGMVRCRLSLSGAPAELERGSQGRWLVSVEKPGDLPLARLSVKLTGENLLTGQKRPHQLVLRGVARRRPMELSALTEHCGILELRADRARVYDYLGLFSKRVPPPQPGRMVCRPVPAEVELPRFPEGQSVLPSPAGTAKKSAGEDWDLRPYRPGDPMRSVHWKLSSKWDELIVRERTDAMSPLPLLTLDRLGPPGRLDALLDRLLGMSEALLAVQRPHAVLWLDRDGQPQLWAVSDERELTACLLALLGAPAPLLFGPALDDRPELLRVPGVPVFRVHIDLKGGADHG